MLGLDGAEAQDQETAEEGERQVEGETAGKGLVGDEPAAEAPPFGHAEGGAEEQKGKQRQHDGGITAGAAEAPPFSVTLIFAVP